MKLFEEASNNKSIYEPYKYVMSDMSHLFIGAKYTYEELLDSDEIGFKLKAVLTHYILKESDKETSLESDFYYMEEGTFTYQTYEQLKVRVKVQILENKKSLFGKEKLEYKETVMTLKELVSMNLAKKKGAGMVVTEIIISKLALMSFSV